MYFFFSCPRYIFRQHHMLSCIPLQAFLVGSPVLLCDVYLCVAGHPDNVPQDVEMIALVIARVHVV